MRVHYSHELAAVEDRLHKHSPPLDQTTVATIMESFRGMNSPAELSALIARDAARFAEEAQAD